MNIIITGPKGCGKSTLISKVAGGFAGTKSGFITEFDNRQSSSRQLLLKALDGTQSRCAVKWSEGTARVFPDVFNEHASHLINIESELIIIDELGKFEKNCKELEACVMQAFSSPANVLACVRLDAEGWMEALKFRSDTTVIDISKDNRDMLPGHILKKLTGSGKLQ